MTQPAADDRRLVTMHDLDALIEPLDSPPDCDTLLREVMALSPSQVVEEIRLRWPQLRRDAWAFALLCERMGRERLFRPYASLSEWARRELKREAWVVSKHRAAAQWVLSLDPDDRRLVMEATPPAVLSEAGLPDLAQTDPKEALKLAKQGLTQRELRQAVRARLMGHKPQAALEEVRAFHKVLPQSVYRQLEAAWNRVRYFCQTPHPSDAEIAEMLAVEVLGSLPIQAGGRFTEEQVDAGRARCIECGASNGNMLELHHAIPRSVGRGDGPLVALCQRCHQTVTENVEGTWKDRLKGWMERRDLQWLREEVERYLEGRSLDAL